MIDLENVAEFEVEMQEAGPQGLSAYEIYLKNGGTLSETEWLDSLKGETGQKGDKGDTGSIKIIPVTELPTENIDTTAIYIRPSKNTDDKNKYEELIYVNGDWEPFGDGSVNVDLSGYYTKEEIDSDMGLLENLNTEDKSSLVGAINEVAMNSGGETTEKLYIIEFNSIIYGTNTAPSMSNDFYQQIIDDYFNGINVGIIIRDYNSNSFVFTFDEQIGSNRLRASTTALAPTGNFYRIIFSLNFDANKKFTKTGWTRSTEATVTTKDYVDNAIAQLKAELSGGTE